MSVLLDIDPLTATTEMMDYDEQTKTLSITRTQNVQAVLDANEAVRNDSSELWRGQDNSMWHVASVPLNVLQGWLNEFNIGKAAPDRLRSYLDPRDDWQTFLWRKLQSSEHYKFKLTPKRL